MGGTISATNPTNLPWTNPVGQPGHMQQGSYEIPEGGINGNRETDLTSSYNRNYYLMVPRVEVIYSDEEEEGLMEEGMPISVLVHFDVRGNGSMGRLQNPERSTLNNGRAVSCVYDQNDPQRRISGVLDFQPNSWSLFQQSSDPIHFKPLESGYPVLDLRNLYDTATKDSCVTLHRLNTTQRLQNLMHKKQEEGEEASLRITVRVDGGPEEEVETFPEAEVGITN